MFRTPVWFVISGFRKFIGLVYNSISTIFACLSDFIRYQSFIYIIQYQSFIYIIRYQSFIYIIRYQSFIYTKGQKKSRTWMFSFFLSETANFVF